MHSTSTSDKLGLDDRRTSFTKPEDITEAQWTGAVVYYRRYYNRLQEKKKHYLGCLDDFRIKICEMVLQRFEQSLGEANLDDARLILELKTKLANIRNSIDVVKEDISFYRENSFNMICNKAREYMVKSIRVN